MNANTGLQMLAQNFIAYKNGRMVMIKTTNATYSCTSEPLALHYNSLIIEKNIQQFKVELCGP